MLIDLTDAFGAGNEPTYDWCEANIPYFVGTMPLTTKGTVLNIACPYDGIWKVGSTYESYIIPVNVGDKYVIDTHESNGSLAHFLADFTHKPSHGESSDNTGSRLYYVQLTANSRIEGTVKEGIKYISITTMYDSNVRTPRAVYINDVKCVQEV